MNDQMNGQMSEGNCVCGEKAIYYRRHEGRYYCKSCLCRSVEKRFRRTASKFIARNDRIAVAFSGGKDSAVLLHLMHKFFSDRAEIFALTIDEGIAGYRDKSIDIARGFIDKLCIEHHIVSFKDEFGIKIDDIKTEKYCTYCGVFRRDLLNKAAQKVGATKIAVGHNLDDEAQSVIMNFFKGDMAKFSRLGEATGSSRQERLTAATGNVFIQKIKPLRNVSEKEIMLYAMINNIPFYNGECPHSFNNMRRDVQAMINDIEEKYPGTKLQVVRFYDKIKPEAPEMIKNNCKVCGAPASQPVCKSCELSEKAKSLQ